MKKTIIITIAMLYVFGAVVMFGADRVSNDWQQPQQDDVEISTVSPVERVEEEYKEYSYGIDEKSKYIENVDDGMLTYSEASSIMGSALESILPTLKLSEKTATIGLYRYPKNEDILIYAMQYKSNVANSEEPIYIVAEPYTGKIIFVYLYATPENGIETNDYLPPIGEEEFLDIITSHLNMFGVRTPTKYSVVNNSTNYNGNENYIGRRAMLLIGDYVSQIEWAYNEEENILFYCYGYDNGDMPVLTGLRTEQLREYIEKNGNDM